MHANKIQPEQSIRDLFLQQLNLLKVNREKVPLDILKTKYKKGYESLCQELKTTGSQYAKQLTLSGIRFHKDYMQEGAERINRIIEQSGLMKQLSKAVFVYQDIVDFEKICGKLQTEISREADVFYREHLGILITEECLVSPDASPMVFSMVNGCVLVDDKWIPKEEYTKTAKYNMEDNT